MALDERYNGHVDAVMTFVSEITKNAFVDGLNEPFNLTVRGIGPTSLEEAKSAAEEQFQFVERNRKFNSAGNNKTGSSPQNFQNNKFQNRLQISNQVLLNIKINLQIFSKIINNALIYRFKTILFQETISMFDQIFQDKGSFKPNLQWKLIFPHGRDNQLSR